MATRSQRLYLADVAADTITVALTVPAGSVYLLKTIVAVNVGGADASHVARVQNGVTFVRVFSAILVPLAPSILNCWLALNAGDVLDVQSFGQNSRWYVSGAKLPAPP